MDNHECFDVSVALSSELIILSETEFRLFYHVECKRGVEFKCSFELSKESVMKVAILAEIAENQQRYKICRIHVRSATVKDSRSSFNSVIIDTRSRSLE